MTVMMNKERRTSLDADSETMTNNNNNNNLECTIGSSSISSDITNI